ncbi:MAG: MFS transporter [Gammaproteobacteria bacterium]|nr:MFS transporter [Gammaproteobacteria bacterium]
MVKPAVEVDATPWPAPRRGWILALLLALASIASQFDRTVINLTVEPLKEAFALNDTQFGMLQGVAFGIFYTVACIPIGRLADRYQRRIVLAISLFFFSLFSMGSGLTRNYLQLFLTRVGVGVGEASVTPAGLSMLSDHFPPERLGRPIGAFLMSAPVGQGLAFIFGGALIQWLTTSGVLQSVPMLSGLAPWQAAFIVIGFPGLLLVPAFLLFKEPVRRGPGGNAPLSLAEMGTILRRRARALIPMFAGFSMVTLVSYAYFIWTPAFMQRTYGLNPAEVGLGFGLVVMTFGTAGAFFGGWMSDRLSARGYLDAPLRVAAFGFIGCGLFGGLATLMPSAPLALLFLAPAIFLSNTPYACAGTSIQLITPNRARGQVTAIYITLITLVGLGVGPTVVGLMTDHIFKDPADIRYSLALVVALPAPVMFVLLMTALRPYREIRQQLQAEAGSND